MLFNEPKLLKLRIGGSTDDNVLVSVLFNEPKLLKSDCWLSLHDISSPRFSALQRAEIAEICIVIAPLSAPNGFSALQRAEIAEIQTASAPESRRLRVSVLFNEPKLLK